MAALVEQALALGGEVNYLTPGEGRQGPTRSISSCSIASGACGRCASRLRLGSEVNRISGDGRDHESLDSAFDRAIAKTAR